MAFFAFNHCNLSTQKTLFKSRKLIQADEPVVPLASQEQIQNQEDLISKMLSKSSVEYLIKGQRSARRLKTKVVFTPQLLSSVPDSRKLGTTGGESEGQKSAKEEADDEDADGVRVSESNDDKKETPNDEDDNKTKEVKTIEDAQTADKDAEPKQKEEKVIEENKKEEEEPKKEEKSGSESEVNTSLDADKKTAVENEKKDNITPEDNKATPVENKETDTGLNENNKKSTDATKASDETTVKKIEIVCPKDVLKLDDGTCDCPAGIKKLEDGSCSSYIIKIAAALLITLASLFF